jgi:Glycosyltransferase like family 2
MSLAAHAESLETLRLGVDRLRGDPSVPPRASVVVPVNAQADLENVLAIVGDITRYEGPSAFELVLVINNYPDDHPPRELETYAGAGIQTVGVPAAWRTGEVVSFTARIPGARAAGSEFLIHFDADCRLPNPTALLDWYVSRLEEGAAAAYTRVGYYDLRPLWSVRARIAVHHGARWAKRNILRIPTIRGSNYAIGRSLFLSLYDQGLLMDDLNVGPTVKAKGGAVAYSRDGDLQVLTSGRKFQGGWLKLIRYLGYRLGYNVRMIPAADRKRKARYHREPMR